MTQANDGIILGQEEDPKEHLQDGRLWLIGHGELNLSMRQACSF
jgi:hypothetical protein